MTNEEKTWTEMFEVSEGDKEFLGRKEWAICAATFYEDLSDRLIAGAVEGFREAIETRAFDVIHPDMLSWRRGPTPTSSEPVRG